MNAKRLLSRIVGATFSLILLSTLGFANDPQNKRGPTPKVLNGNESAMRSHPLNYQPGSPWPRNQGNNSATGATTASGRNGSLLWKSYSGDNYYSQPAIGADGTLYEGGLYSHLWAYNPDGSVKWRSNTIDQTFSTPSIGSDGTIYVVDVSGHIYAFSPDGQRLWMRSVGYYVTDPNDFSGWPMYQPEYFLGSTAICPNGNIVVEGHGGVYWFNPSGDRISFYQTILFTDPGDSFIGTPSISADGTVYCVAQNIEMFAFDSEGHGGYIAAVPGVQDSVAIGPSGTLYVEGLHDSSVRAMTASGATLWTYNSGHGMNKTPTIGPDGTIYCASWDGFVFALNSDGTLKWNYNHGNSPEGSLLIDGAGTLYVTYTDGFIEARNSSDGTTKWTFTGGSGDYFPSSCSMDANGVLYVGGYYSNFYAIGTPPPVAALSSLTLSPSTIVGGNNATGTVTLDHVAGSGGATVTLSDTWNGAYPQYINVPSSVIVPAGADHATFDISAPTVAPITFSDTIVAALGTKTFSATLSVQTTDIVGLSITLSNVQGGTNLTGTVTLGSPAGVGGSSIALSSQYQAFVTVPVTVTVAEGATTGTFNVTTKGATSNIVCTITASDSSNIHAYTKVTVVGNIVSGLSLSPSTVGGGETSTATVTLTNPAPAAGWKVNLSAQYPTLVSVPASLVVPAGATSANFTITPKEYSGNITCIIVAGDGITGRSATLSVVGDSVSSLSLNPSTVGGGTTSTGTVTLASAAPEGGWKLTLTAQYPSLVSVPSTLVVPAGATSANFTITPKEYSGNITCIIAAVDGTTGRSATLSVIGDSVSSLSLNPSTVGGGTTSTGTVTLSSAAPVGGWKVNLSAQYPSFVSVPPSLVVPAGATSANFTITPKEYSGNITCIIVAGDGTTGRSAVLSVVGDSISSLTLNPTSTIGKAGSTGTVTLSSPAPTGGWTVSLTTQYATLVGVPGTVFVPAGQSSANFPITTKVASTQYTCIVAASDGTTGRSALLTITTH